MKDSKIEKPYNCLRFFKSQHFTVIVYDIIVNCKSLIYFPGCSVLAAEVEAYKEQLKNAEAALPPPPVILPQAAHPYARPRCGYVSAEEAAKFNVSSVLV